MKSTILTIALALMLGSFSVQGQTSLGARTVQAVDTLFISKPDTFLIQVENTDTALFNGMVSVLIRVNGGTPLSMGPFHVILPPHAIELIGSTSFDYDSLDLQPAQNIVVVWPTGTGIQATDSATASIYMIDDTGIRDSQHDATGLRVFPNPATGRFYISGLPRGSDFERVRISAISGKVVYSEEHPPCPFTGPGLPPGFYIIDCILPDQTEAKLKAIILE